MPNYILKEILVNGEFETWKLKDLLQVFIEHPEKTKMLLDTFYRLSSGAVNSQGDVKHGLKFLQHLGLNYFYWMDRGYLQTHFGKKWQLEFAKCKSEIPFYREQLVPVAKKILESLENGNIVILDDDNYRISDELKEELETEDSFKLRHHERTDR